MQDFVDRGTRRPTWRSIASGSALAWVAAGLVVGCNAILGIGDPTIDATDGGTAGDGALANADGAASDASTETADGAPGAVADAAADADGAALPPCDLTGDYTVSELASVNSALDEGSVRLSEDELTITFDSERATATGNRYDMFIAQRANRNDPFVGAQPIPGTGLNTTDFEYSANIVDQGLTIIFERQAAATDVSKLMRATRLDPNGAFDTPVEVPDVNASCDYIANPFARGTANDLFFVRACGPVKSNIYYGELVGAGYPNFGPVSANINTNNAEYEPSLSADKKTLHFSREIAGNYDIYVTTRNAVGSAWSTPQPLANPVNTTTSNESPGWLSPDGCRLYFVSNRPGGTGKQDIYVASRPAAK